MHYQIKECLDLDIIGKYPQSQEGIYHTYIKSPDYLNNIEYVPVNYEISVPAFKIASKAKLTDLLSVSANGINARLVICEKLKSILEKYTDGKAQFFETYAKQNIINERKYFILHPFHFTYNNLDFRKSEIWIERLGNTRLRKAEPKTQEELDQLILQLKLPDRINISKTIFLRNVTENFFIMKRVNTGIGYYISDQVKTEIEMANCIGIVFEPCI